jgi:hypothetical protein
MEAMTRHGGLFDVRQSEIRSERAAGSVEHAVPGVRLPSGGIDLRGSQWPSYFLSVLKNADLRLPQARPNGLL